MIPAASRRHAVRPDCVLVGGNSLAYLLDLYAWPAFLEFSASFANRRPSAWG